MYFFQSNFFIAVASFLFTVKGLLLFYLFLDFARLLRLNNGLGEILYFHFAALYFFRYLRSFKVALFVFNIETLFDDEQVNRENKPGTRWCPTPAGSCRCS